MHGASPLIPYGQRTPGRFLIPRIQPERRSWAANCSAIRTLPVKIQNESGGNLVATFFSTCTVRTLALSLAGLSVAPSAGLAAQFRQPVRTPAISQARSATLYVSSFQNSTVTEYSLPGGTVIGTLGTPEGIYGPGGLFFTSGHL